MKTKTLILWLFLSAAIPSFASNIFLFGDLYYCCMSDSTVAVVSDRAIPGETYNYSELTAVIIPKSVTYNDITYSVTSIGWSAFHGCIRLTSITIPNSVTSIGMLAFANCHNLTKTNYTGSIADWCRITFSDNSSNPISYSHNLFINDILIKDLVIPEEITTINDYAFYDCTSLTSVTIPNSVTNIGANAFYNVANIVYSGTATGSPWGARSVNGYVEDYLVYADATKTTLLACSSAATGAITIPNSVTTIGKNAFHTCTGLISITIPNSVTTIGDYAFGSVANIVYSGTATGSPWGAKSVNGYVEDYLVYADATKTTLLACYNTVTGAITIPDGVTSIGNSAFEGCIGLTSITIPNSVAYIGIYAFSGTSWYDNQPDGVVYINNILYHYKGTMPQGTNIVVKEGTTCISGCAFQGCTGLTSITIPNSVMTIDWSAFSGCTGLTSITIPNGVTSIGSETFYNCTGLESVTCYADVPPTIDSKTFYKVSNNVELHVLANAVDEYKADEYWSRFTIVPIGVDNTTDGTLTVHPSQTDVTFTWPADNNADSYTLTIQKGDVVFCTLIFNGEGQLTTIAFAPARNGEKHTPNATLTTEGYKFTVMGLDEASYYTYQIVVKDREDNVLNTYQGEFRTQENIDTVVEDILTGNSSTKTQKILRNGQVVILHPGKTYNTIGQEVK